MMILRHKLRTLRELHNYKQSFVAVHLGIGQSAYSRIENGSTGNVPLKYIEKLAKLYKMDLETLFGWKGIVSGLDVTNDSQEQNHELPETRIRILEERVAYLINKLGS
jgi:transcriptional regulator with XRE-family HTH domain